MDKVEVAWPRKGGKVHRIDSDPADARRTSGGFPVGDGKVRTACGSGAQIATSAFGDEPAFSVRTIAHDEFMRDVDTCARCKAGLAERVVERIGAPVVTAWTLVGESGEFRLVGGRAVYEAVDYNDETGGENVRLAKVVSDERGLRRINRYVDPDALVEVLTLDTTPNEALTALVGGAS